jgi:hypothetical protein
MIFPTVLDPFSLLEARELLKHLQDTAPGHSIDRLYEHWAVSTYTETFDDYNLMVVKHPNGYYYPLITHDPRTNAAGVNMAGHTAGRNTGALGISVAAMLEATPNDFGPYPLSIAMMECFCATVGACAFKYGIDVSGTTHDGEPNIMTHAECAIADSYFPGDPVVTGKNESGPPYRWDLARLEAGPSALSKSEALLTGDLLRMRIRAYKVALVTSGNG